MIDAQKLVEDFKRLTNRPFCGAREWTTQNENLSLRCVHGHLIEKCFTCQEEE